MSDELTAAFKRTDALGSEYVDRKGWTKKQWADDAQRIMSHIDGAASALKNGHVNGLLARIRELTPRTIETAEEMDALPAGSVVRCKLGIPHEKQSDGEGGTDWKIPDSTESLQAYQIDLPATVLHEPTP
jgi:hypothetical protein